MDSTADETGASTAGTEGTATGTGTAQGSTASTGTSSTDTMVDGAEPLWKQQPVIYLAAGLVTIVVVLALVAFLLPGEDEVTLRPLPSDGSSLNSVPSTIPKDFMVCTINGEGPSYKDFVAPRTVCDIIFFDSVHKVVHKEVQATFNNSLQNFAYWTHAQQGGEFGYSYSLESGELRDKVVDAKLEEEMKKLYDLKIRHTAVMNIHGTSATKDGFGVALRTLRTAFKVVSELESQSQSKRTIYTVIGAAIKDESTLQDMLSEMKDVNFEPSMFISVTHVSHEDRALQDCRIVPPTWLSLPNDEVSYGLSLTSSCQMLQEVAKAASKITLAVSFTVSGHMYKPQGNDPDDYKLFSPCEDFNGNYYVKPYEFCKKHSEYFDKLERSEQYMLTFSTSEQRALTFESWGTIKNKLCEARSNCPGVTFGVAAYDIEYDYQPYRSVCQKFDLVGPFGRVGFLKKMNGYLTKLSSADAFNKEQCLNVEIV